MSRPWTASLLRALSYLAGVSLTAAAILWLWRSAQWPEQALDRPALLVLLALAVLANLLLAGAMFWVVTLSFDASPPVGSVRMTALIAVSALWNYLPLRPGLVGRAVYLRSRHGIPLHQSVVILGIVMVTAAVVLGSTGLIIAVALPDQQVISFGAAMVLQFLLAVVTGPIAGRLLRRRVVWSWAWVAIRVIDMLAAGSRMYLAFLLVGAPITYGQAIAVGAAGMLISLAGLTPNGLGMKEWAIAAVGALLAPASTAAGLAAALLDRAVEAVVVAVTGSAAMVWLGSELRATSRGAPRQEPTPLP